MKIKWLLIALPFVLLTSLWLYQISFGHFKVEYITYEKVLLNPWEFPTPAKEVLDQLEIIFSEPFTYLGEGHQSYAFLSHNKQFVLKFFKFKKGRKVERVFQGYGLAYKYDRKNCGLLYVHLAPTQNLNKKVCVLDRLGRKHVIDLDSTIFIIQEKATVSNKYLADLLMKKDIESFKACLDQIFELYVNEYKMGLFDRDHNILHNSGFVNGKFIRTDIGKLILDSEYAKLEEVNKDLRKIAWERIDSWVSRYFPEYKEEIALYLTNKLQEIHLSYDVKN